MNYIPLRNMKFLRNNTVPATHVQRVLQELDYRIDICRVTNCGHIEHL